MDPRINSCPLDETTITSDNHKQANESTRNHPSEALHYDANSTTIGEIRNQSTQMTQLLPSDTNYLTSTQASAQSASPQSMLILQENLKPSDSSAVTSMGANGSISNGTMTQQYPYQLEALDESWQLPIITLYSLTAITSFLLNVVTVIVLARCRRTELRKYLINLSMSDLLMSLFSIPFTYTEYMLGRWVLHSFLCPIVRFVVVLSVFVSAATMTVIGVNRHLAIIYPLRRRKGTENKRWAVRKTHVIVAVWLVGILIATPEYLMHSALQFCHRGHVYHSCQPIWPETILNHYTIFIFLCTFAIPLTLLSYLYTCIGLKLWRHQTPGEKDAHRDLSMLTTRIKVIKMLAAVVIGFAVSWLPLQTFTMVTFLYPEIKLRVYDSTEWYFFIWTYFASHWLSMAHSCLNPIIYCFMNEKFRSDLQALICSAGSGSGGCSRQRDNNNNNNKYLSTSVSQLQQQQLVVAGGCGNNNAQAGARELATTTIAVSVHLPPATALAVSGVCSVNL